MLKLSRFLIPALAVSAVIGQNAPSFEVATVRPTAGPVPGIPPVFGQQKSTPDTLNIRHTPLIEIIKRAYGVVDQELVAPDSIRDQRYDIVGKSAMPATDAQLWVMMRALLEERFKLKYHREPRQVSGLALVIAKGGPKLKASEGGSNEISIAGGLLKGHNVTIVRLSQILTSFMRQPVIDETGLAGTYDFTADPRSYLIERTDGAPLDLQGMIVTAIQESLGLKMESRKLQLQVMVIDHIERPEAN